MTLTPPMPYSGGKQNLAAAIVGQFPEHTHYVEPFAGALSVLLAKPPSKIETINDLNGDIVTFWRILRERPADLERVCALTPHSREEFVCAADMDTSPSDLERARRVWVRLTQGRGAMLGARNGWRFTHGTNRMALARYLDGYLARIAPAAERLRGVAIECRDAVDVIAAYDRPDALFYVDPPYLGSTRRGAQYAHELITDADHERLLDVLTGCVGKVALSGYDSPLYAQRLSGWRRATFSAAAMTGESRTEVLWMNYEPVRNEPLFEMTP